MNSGEVAPYTSVPHTWHLPPPLPPSLQPPPRPSPPPTAAYIVAAFLSLAGDAQWRALYDLSYHVFTKLIENLDPNITPSDLPLPSDFDVAMVLFRLAHGHSAKSLASWYNLVPYSISKITNTVTRLLATKLYKDYVKIPSSRHRLIETTQAFEELTSLHNLCGAIDGTPIKLRRCRINKYRCRYGYSSVQLQVVSDHKKVFWDICARENFAIDDFHADVSFLEARARGQTLSEFLRPSRIDLLNDLVPFEPLWLPAPSQVNHGLPLVAVQEEK